LAAVSETASAQRDETEALRARVAELERELAERTERANAAVAAAEDRLYWLDRWGVDLDALMQRRAAQRAFRLVEKARRARRLAGKVRRRLLRR
jgi:cell division septum initiation protein DivIVA